MSLEERISYFERLVRTRQLTPQEYAEWHSLRIRKGDDLSWYLTNPVGVVFVTASNTGQLVEAVRLGRKIRFKVGCGWLDAMELVEDELGNFEQAGFVLPETERQQILARGITWEDNTQRIRYLYASPPGVVPVFPLLLDEFESARLMVKNKKGRWI